MNLPPEVTPTMTTAIDATLLAPKTLLIFCDGGLANRINSLLGGLVLAEQLGWAHQVLWPRNNRCGAGYGQIFEGGTAHEVRLQDLVPHQDGLQLWLHENDVGFSGPVRALRKLQSTEQLPALLGDDKRAVLYCENIVLPWLPEAAVQRALLGLRLQADLLARARLLRERHTDGGYIGIHLRATDFTSAPPTESMLALVQARQDVRFFVCSDDAALERRFAEQPNVFVNPKAAYVEKLEDGPWRSAVHDSDGLPYTSNIERNALSVVEACVDLLLLAGSTAMRTSASSFLALAGRMKQAGYVEQHLPAAQAAATPPEPVMQAHASQQEIIELLNLLRPHHIVSDYKVRIGGDADGGYVMPSVARKTNAVISIGIGDQVSFDAELAELGAVVLQYDHTIPGAPLVHPRLRFHHQGWGPRDEAPLLSLHSMMSGIDWATARHAILKFDTEGAEWDALEATTSDDLARFEIIAGEFHGFHNLAHRGIYQRIRSVLEKIARTHVPVHLHANNATGIRLVQGVPVPPLLEITFLRRDAAVFGGHSNEPIPGPLDRPNMADRPDICLRPF